MNLPCAISDFGEIRREGFYYADKTRFIPRLEDKQRGRRYVLFLRPRRFGKTTLLSMLEHYYDIARKERFDALFAGLHVGEHPTPNRNRYLILKLDFSGVGLQGGVEAMHEALVEGLRLRIRDFFLKYQALLPGLLGEWLTHVDRLRSPSTLLGGFLDFLRPSPYPMYILVDEYDKLVNDLIARNDHGAYHDVLAASGWLRLMYERIKIATDHLVQRVFMTGISPIMLNDLASGFNITKNLSLSEEYSDLCGFSQGEVEALLDHTLAAGGYTLSREQVLDDLRRYYNGYRFSGRRGDRLYNPSAVLNFLAELNPPDKYPRELIDSNLRTDHQKLYTLLFTPNHEPRQRPMEIVRSLLTEGSIVGRLYDLFPLQQAYDDQFFPSYLYYLGLTTIIGEDLDQLRMAIPNLTIQGIHGSILSYILEQAAGIQLGADHLHGCIRAMAQDGALAPFLELIDSQVLQKLSNRDLIRLDERGLKMLLLAYLSMSEQFLPFSEMELHRGYSDLILILNRRFASRYSFLIELKYVKDEGRDDRALRAAAQGCFVEGEAQLQSYLQDQRLKAVEGPAGWKAFTVVQIGTRALLCREIGKETQTLRWERRRPTRKTATAQPKKPAAQRLTQPRGAGKGSKTRR